MLTEDGKVTRTGWLTVPQVADLTGKTERWIEMCIDSGSFEVKSLKSDIGQGGISYLVSVQSLPLAAQIKYLHLHGEIKSSVSDDCDLVGYEQRYGKEGLDELKDRLTLVQKGITIRKLSQEKALPLLDQLAHDNGISTRTLYRYMDGYEAKGLPGIMRTTRRKDAGQARQMCAAVHHVAYYYYMHQVKRTQSSIYDKLLDIATVKGKTACQCCIFNTDSDARLTLTAEELDEYKPCTEPQKQGMIIPGCRQTVSRVLAAIPQEEVVMARRGNKAYRDFFMPMATREVPKEVNHIWFGDHHQFDCFVLDRTGKPVRPWLTSWYDAGSSCQVGWCLNTNPNTSTVNGDYLCEAAIKETMQLIGENPERIGEHIAKQQRAMRDVKNRIKTASRNVFTDEVADKAGNILSLSYEQAAEGRKRKRAEIKATEGTDTVEDKTRSLFGKLGADVINFKTS